MADRTDGAADVPVLGIDLGGTKILTAVGDRKGTLLSRDHRGTPADGGPDAVIGAIEESVVRVLDQASLELKQLAGIGIGAPGPCNTMTGIVHRAPNLPGWRDVPIRDILADKFGKKTVLINDGSAAALAEQRFGAGRDARCFIYLTVSTGIGGGIVIDGKVFTGATGGAAEFGHMTIDDDGPPCNCGNRGCWEVLASGTALAQSARRRIAEGRSTAILSNADGDLENVTARAVHQAARSGDALAGELILDIAHYLGTGLANLINLFNPDVIALGGGMMQMGDLLLDPARQIARRRAFPSAVEAVRIVSAALGRNNGVLGAAAHAFDEIADSG